MTNSRQSKYVARLENMAAARLARANKHLDTRLNYSGYGIMSRREFLTESKRTGSRTLAIVTVADETKIRSVESRLQQLWRKGEPSGNRNWPDTKEFLFLRDELAAGYTKQEYRLVSSAGGFLVLSKTEYDFWNSL